MARRQNNFLRMLGLWLVMATFLGIAAWQAVALGRTLANIARSQGWQAVPAVVLRADLSSEVFKSNSPRRKDGTVFQAQGLYEYEFAGRKYRGQRLSFAEGQDNSGWHTTLNAEMQAAQAAGRPVTVFVNPSQPEEAVYARGTSTTEFVFLVLFVLCFGGMAAVLAWEIGLFAALGRARQQWLRR